MTHDIDTVIKRLSTNPVGEPLKEFSITTRTYSYLATTYERIDSIEEIYASAGNVFVVRTPKTLLLTHVLWRGGIFRSAYRVDCPYDLMAVIATVRRDLGYGQINCMCGRHGDQP